MEEWILAVVVSKCSQDGILHNPEEAARTERGEDEWVRPANAHFREVQTGQRVPTTCDSQASKGG